MTTLTADGAGPYVHTFEDYTPSRRLDGSAWTNVIVEEAPAKTGPWTQYAHGPLSPVDSDPTDPRVRSFTAPGATLAICWNRITFLDAASNKQPFRATYVGAPWTPSTGDVARVLRSRVYVGGGRVPDFLDESDIGGPTDPTRSEVEELIDDAASDVASKVAAAISDAAAPIAQRVAVLGAALLIEVGSDDFDRERYDRLQTLYDTRLAQLLDAAQDEATGGEIGDADDRAVAIGTFPAGGTNWDCELF